jgi:hypothetical protein
MRWQRGQCSNFVRHQKEKTLRHQIGRQQLTVVHDHHELEHMVVERKRHLVERRHVSVQRRNGEHIRLITQGGPVLASGAVVSGFAELGGRGC